MHVLPHKDIIFKPISNATLNILCMRKVKITVKKKSNVVQRNVKDQHAMQWCINGLKHTVKHGN